MRINCNISSIIAKNALGNNDMRLAKSTQRLSSGYKINSAKDNAAGLAIARKMNAQIKSLEQANQNANDGVSVVNTADGAMAEMHDILQRMNELAVQAANGINANSDRELIQEEIDQLVQEIDRIANTTQFNAQCLLDGSFAYKAYTNAENVKVMSYGDGVQSGIYAIDSLTYYHYEDKVTTYDLETKKNVGLDGVVTTTLNKTVKDITTNERYGYAANAAEDIQKALFGTASIAAYKTDSGVYEETLRNGSGEMKAFTEDVRVVLDEENVILKGKNDFEVKIALNDKTTQFVNSPTTVSANANKVLGLSGDVTSATISANQKTGVTTTKITTIVKTECYKNITVKTVGGSDRYNITELNFAEEYDTKDYKENVEKGKTLKQPDAEEIGGEGAGIYTSAKEKGLRDLEEDFAELFEGMYPDCDVNVISIEYDENNKTFAMDISATDKKTGKNVNFDSKESGKVTSVTTTPCTITSFRFELFQEKDEHGKVTDKTLEDYHYSTTETTKTKYTVGETGKLANSITLDLTGMGPMEIQVGANAGQIIEIEIPALNAINLGIDDLDLTTEDKATAAIDIVGNAINELSKVRAKIGAYTNRLEHTIANLDTTQENMTQAYSRIMDVDMATEMTEYSTVQVLVQSATSMLAQANEQPQQVLQLLQ